MGETASPRALARSAPTGAGSPAAMRRPARRNRHLTPGPELLRRRAPARGQLRRLWPRQADDLQASRPASAGCADTSSRGPFTETFFLPPFRWKQILDSNRPGHVAARLIGRPGAAEEDLTELGPPQLSQVEARWRWPRT